MPVQLDMEAILLDDRRHDALRRLCMFTLTALVLPSGRLFFDSTSDSTVLSSPQVGALSFPPMEDTLLASEISRALSSSLGWREWIFYFVNKLMGSNIDIFPIRFQLPVAGSIDGIVQTKGTSFSIQFGQEIVQSDSVQVDVERLKLIYENLRNRRDRVLDRMREETLLLNRATLGAMMIFQERFPMRGDLALDVDLETPRHVSEFLSYVTERSWEHTHNKTNRTEFSTSSLTSRPFAVAIVIQYCSEAVESRPTFAIVFDERFAHYCDCEVSLYANDLVFESLDYQDVIWLPK